MNTLEYLAAVKEKLNITSDYALAKALDISQARISAYRKGREHPDVYTCIKVAIALGIDPTLVIAEIEQQNERNTKKAAFWRDFVLHYSKHAAAVMLALTLLSGFGAGAGQAAGVAVMAASALWLARRGSYNVYYVK